MSVRAHRINKIDYDGESFNLWHDEKLMDFLQENGFYDQLNDDGTGVTEIGIDILQEAIKKAKKLKLAKDLIKTLKHDIEWAKKQKLEYIQYYCF